MAFEISIMRLDITKVQGSDKILQQITNLNIENNEQSLYQLRIYHHSIKTIKLSSLITQHTT